MGAIGCRRGVGQRGAGGVDDGVDDDLPGRDNENVYVVQAAPRVDVAQPDQDGQHRLASYITALFRGR